MTFPRHSHRGFTLPEVLVSMAILLVVIGIAVSCQMYGLRMFEFVKPKLSASDDARRVIGALIADVRQARTVRVGTGSASSFVEVQPNFQQRGNALQVHHTPDTNLFTRYYWDGTDQKLKRLSNLAPVPVPIAHSVSNELVFSCEDFAGRVLTNNHNNRVIAVTLQFYQIQYPKTPIGPGNFYDFYQVQTKITRRTLL